MTDHDTADSPYTAPNAQLQDNAAERAAEHYGDASQGQRFLNLLVDYCGAALFAFVVAVVMGITGTGEHITGPVGAQAFGIGVMLGYYLIFEWLTGRTLGKLVTGTRVIDQFGNRPSFLKVLGRSVTRFVPFEPFSFFGGENGCWHDAWSGTRVVRTRPTAWQKV